jgi:ABC-2 type transport system ATP-binding protein
MEGAFLELEGVTYRHRISAPVALRPWRKAPGPGVFDASLRLYPGEILGLVGPNGAGKTTLLRTIAGIFPIQSGVCTINSSGTREYVDSEQLRSLVGHMPEQVRWQGAQSVEDALMELAEMRGATAKRVSGLLQLVGLDGRKKTHLSGLSQGMRQRLTLAASLLGSPNYLLLDEPLNGLDPVASAAFVRLLYQLKEKGVSIVISSHQVSGLQEITDRIALMHRGQILACGSIPSIAESLNLQETIDVSGPGELPDFSWCNDVKTKPISTAEGWSFTLSSGTSTDMASFIDRGIVIDSWTPRRPGIVEMLCAATGMTVDEVGLDIASPSMLPHKPLGGEEE